MASAGHQSDAGVRKLAGQVTGRADQGEDTRRWSSSEGKGGYASLPGPEAADLSREIEGATDTSTGPSAKGQDLTRTEPEATSSRQDYQCKIRG